MNDFELHRLCEAYSSIRHFALSDDDILGSGKFQLLDKLLPSIKEKVTPTNALMACVFVVCLLCACVLVVCLLCACCVLVVCLLCTCLQ